MRAIGADEGIALAAPDAADGQLVLVAEPQPQLLGERLDRRRGRAIEDLFRAETGGTGGFRPLSEGFGQRDSSRIGRSEPHRPEILLIYHSLKP
jgi:hypothetical protein